MNNSVDQYLLFTLKCVTDQRTCKISERLLTYGRMNSITKRLKLEKKGTVAETQNLNNRRGAVFSGFFGHKMKKKQDCGLCKFL